MPRKQEKDKAKNLKGSHGHPERLGRKPKRVHSGQPIGDPPQIFDQLQKDSWNEIVGMFPAETFSSFDRLEVELASRILSKIRTEQASNSLVAQYRALIKTFATEQVASAAYANKAKEVKEAKSWWASDVEINYAERATRYAHEVIEGVRPAGELLVKACKRHLQDLEQSQNDPDYPYVFNPKPAASMTDDASDVYGPGDRVCVFAEKMVHIKGRWAGQKIKLQDWQCFLFAVAFGWIRRADGLRRFREAYWEICRKNSKSTMAAIIGLYMTFADNEPAAETLAGATSKEQASFVFSPAWHMVKKNLDFQAHFVIDLMGTQANPGNIYNADNNSTFKVMIGKPGDGASPSCSISDEFHEHQTAEQYNAMKTGMGARLQPFRLLITTAGMNTTGPCFEKRMESKNILDGSRTNDEIFAVIYGIDDEDDWQVFENWLKANPNLGVSVDTAYLKTQHEDALHYPNQTNALITKHAGRWCSAGVAWMNMPKWYRCADPGQSLEILASLERKRRLEAWVAVDLASKIDVCSLAVVVKLKDGKYGLFCRHYIPAETIALKQNTHYQKWKDQGWIIETGGARTDFKRVEDDIKALSKQFAVQNLSFDPREASYLISNIQEWASFECFEVVQGPQHMSQPMKEFEAQVYAGSIVHQSDPVLNWMMGNVIKKEGRTGNVVKYYYPTRPRDIDKIDGVVAGIMALGGAMAGDEDTLDYRRKAEAT